MSKTEDSDPKQFNLHNFSEFAKTANRKKYLKFILNVIFNAYIYPDVIIIPLKAVIKLLTIQLLLALCTI